MISAAADAAASNHDLIWVAVVTTVIGPTAAVLVSRILSHGRSAATEKKITSELDARIGTGELPLADLVTRIAVNQADLAARQGDMAEQNAQDHKAVQGRIDGLHEQFGEVIKVVQQLAGRLDKHIDTHDQQPQRTH